MDIKNSRRAQAFIETAILLLAFVLAAAAFATLVELVMASYEMQSNIRADAGSNALSSTAGTIGHGIKDWNVGPDGIRYTPDDRPVTGLAVIDSPFALNVYSVKSDVRTVDVPALAAEALVGSDKAKTSFKVSIPAMGL